MSIVFVPPPPTPRSRKLAKALHDTIEEFRRENPATRDSEVRRALRIAASFSGGRTPQIAAAAILLLGLIVALGVFTFASDTGEGDMNVPLAVGGIVVLAALAIVSRRWR